MKPEINCTNLYTILFSCVQYVDYFNEVDGDLLNKVLECLYSYKSYLEDIERSDLDGIELDFSTL